ncbi:MAG TPA: Na+/H+ antiporter subunit G [Burkholderiaceae bacterium]|nr:Na+/H+ antiporter subunit G [Burkholderiaceae bacterium]
MDATMPLAVEILISFLLVAGGAFALIGSFGLAKLRDFYLRIHGPTKATTLGIGSTLIASALFFTFDAGTLSVHEVLVTVFMFVTAPVAAHVLTRAQLHGEPQARPPVPPSPGTPTAAELRDGRAG